MTELLAFSKGLCLLVLLGSAGLAYPANAEEDSEEDRRTDAPSAWVDPDPWIGLNRKIYEFNDVLDKAVLRPIARGYTRVMPDPFEQGVSNFFDNVQTPAIALNQLLQGKLRPGASDAARFLVNSTVGVLGLFDVASRWGIAQNDEDFGQTLAVWGIPQGPYFVIPIRGPATVTHAFGMVVDGFTNPIGYIKKVRVRNSLLALYFVDLRKRVLSAEELVTGDEYLFIRDAYLQRRDFLVKDGEFEEDPFEDFEDF